MKKSMGVILCLCLSGCSVLQEVAQSNKPLQRQLLHCWDLSSGRQRWQQDVLDFNPTGQMDGGEVVIAVGLEDVRAYSARDGHQVWKQTIELDPEGSGLVDGRSFYVGLGQVRAKLDLGTGATLWTGGESSGRALVKIGKTVLWEEGQRLAGIDSATGKQRWSVPMGYQTRYLGGGGGAFLAQRGDIVEARSATTGKVLWKVAAPPEFEPALAQPHGNDYLLVAQQGLARLDPRARKFLWVRRAPLGYHPTPPLFEGDSLELRSGITLQTVDWRRGQPVRRKNSFPPLLRGDSALSLLNGHECFYEADDSCGIWDYRSGISRWKLSTVNCGRRTYSVTSHSFYYQEYQQ